MNPGRHIPQFVEAYPHYEFGPLVGITLDLAAWLVRHLERSPRRVHTTQDPKGVLTERP